VDWETDLRHWIKTQFKKASGRAPRPDQFERTSALALRKGWDSRKYKSSLKKELFAWLNDWYLLEEKDMPTPATKTRANPIENTRIVDLYRGLI